MESEADDVVEENQSDPEQYDIEESGGSSFAGLERKRKSYSLGTKFEILRKYDELGGNKSKVAKLCGVSRQCLQDWVRDRERLEQARAERQVTVRKRRYLPSGEEAAKERAKFPRLEAEVVSWIKELRDKGVTVSGSAIQRHAKKVYEEFYPEEDNFRASKGWLDRFTDRHGLTVRSVTSQGKKVPGNAKALAESFLQYVKEIRGDRTFELKSIGNMDETPLWFDLPSSKTFDFRGVKSVQAKTTGK